MMLTMTRMIAAALLIASAAAFAAGVAIERHTVATERPAAMHHVETSAGGERSGGAEHAASKEGTGTHAAELGSEDLLGINPESTGLVVAAVALSLLLAALILTVSSPLIAAGVVLAMLAFTALDIREFTHQLHESRPGLAAVAATVALLHILAAVAALLIVRGRSRPGVRTA